MKVRGRDSKSIPGSKGFDTATHHSHCTDYSSAMWGDRKSWEDGSILGASAMWGTSPANSAAAKGLPIDSPL
jgi:hypothetical protein